VAVDDAPGLKDLEAFLLRVPSVTARIGTGTEPSGLWWVKFAIDIAHPLAWRAVQELGHVLNYLAPDERLPTVFIPVSPPPYMNGGPAEYLSWVIEVKDPKFTPKDCLEWLEGRLPRPVDSVDEWNIDDEDDE
jgi:hypothetical protein